MAKKRGRPPGERNDINVRIDRSLAMMGRAVAQYRGESLAEYFSEVLRPTVAKDYAGMLKNLELDKNR
jgi:hypothetical protein